MTTQPEKKILRLRKKHQPAAYDRPGVADGRRLVEAQSVRDALTAAAIMVVAFAVLWTMLSVVTSRVFPWLTLALGFACGLAVRYAGRGLDWRFPTIAAIATFAGAIVGNIVVAAAYTASELGSDTLTVLRSASEFTWPVFFDEVMTAADFIYAFFAAGIAAFYANRRLTRRQYHAMRVYEDAGK